MAQGTPPEAYGWIAAVVIGLIAALKMAISKITGGRKDPLSEVLKHDLDGLIKHMESLEKETKRQAELIAECVSDIKVIKFRLDLDGDK